MDKPDQDMRNPAYRKSLERKQALEEPPLSPEDLVVGPVKRMYDAGRLLYRARGAIKSAPEIGTNVSHMVRSSKDDLAKKLGLGAKETPELAEKRRKEFKAARTEHLADQVEKEGMDAFRKKYEKTLRDAYRDKMRRQETQALGAETIKDSIKNTVIQRSAGTLGGAAMEAEDKASGAVQRAMERKKAGGVIKSASKRGDGIAQRGKTKGRMV